jgi:hypothetical protein
VRPPDVRFGSLADIAACLFDIRVTSKADKVRASRLKWPLGVKGTFCPALFCKPLKSDERATSLGSTMGEERGPKDHHLTFDTRSRTFSSGEVLVRVERHHQT